MKLYFPTVRRAPSPAGVQIFYEAGPVGSWVNRCDLFRIGVKSAAFGIDTQTGEWQAPPRLDEVMVALSGKSIVLNVAGCRPGWNSQGLANGFPDVGNSLERFASLCAFLQARYKPAWLEIWNEPDIVEGGGMFDWFGALALDQPDGGGARYAAMLRAVRAASPRARILAGALCGGTQSELGPEERFVDGFLSSNPAMDGLSFHHYAHYSISPAAELEGIAGAFAHYHGLTSLPVICTETSYIRPEGYPDTAEFQAWKADYAGMVKFWLVSSSEAAIWYAYDVDWRGAELHGTPAEREWIP